MSQNYRSGESRSGRDTIIRGSNPSPNQRHACICCPEIAEFCFGKKVKSTGLLFSSSGGRLVPQRLWVVIRETLRLRALGQYKGGIFRFALILIIARVSC